MGWLHAIPKSDNPRDKNSNSKRESRATKFKDGHLQARLPDADGYIIGAFQMLGLCGSSGMGIAPLSWSEVDSFCSRSTYELEDWQCECVISMSRHYVNWTRKGESVDCFSPWDDTSDEAILAHREYMRTNSSRTVIS